MRKEWKYIVVGGGLCGLMVAYRLRGETLIIERKKRIGEPNHCGGVVSVDYERKLELGYVNTRKQNIYGFAIHTINGKKIEIETPKPCCIVIDRPSLDREIFRRISKDSEKTLEHGYVKEVVQDRGEVKIVLRDGETLRCERAIVGEGAQQVIRRKMGKGRLSAVPGVHMIVETKELDEHFNYLFLDERLSAHRLSYIISMGEDLYKIGVVDKGNIRKVVEKIAERYVRNYRLVGFEGGLVWLHGPLRMNFGRVYFVGDAAGHTKPTTGGGIVIGGIMSTQLAKNLNGEAVDKNEIRKIHNEILIMKFIRRILNKIDDYTLEKIVLNNKEELKKLLMEEYDWHGTALLHFTTKAVRKGKLATFLLEALKGIFKTR
ncbi:MAG TPA: NAD(P)/FAD-dependent oxidoreductase [Candidatus Bathyarchaeota archaeon]|nr:NAD(P)/FAD-dependent oxidoreductase [Candidatus Bathyarchaeota archaeon]